MFGDGALSQYALLMPRRAGLEGSVRPGSTPSCRRPAGWRQSPTHPSADPCPVVVAGGFRGVRAIDPISTKLPHRRPFKQPG